MTDRDQDKCPEEWPVDSRSVTKWERQEKRFELWQVVGEPGVHVQTQGGEEVELSRDDAVVLREGLQRMGF